MIAYVGKFFTISSQFECIKLGPSLQGKQVCCIPVFLYSAHLSFLSLIDSYDLALYEMTLSDTEFGDFLYPVVSHNPLFIIVAYDFHQCFNFFLVYLIAYIGFDSIMVIQMFLTDYFTSLEVELVKPPKLLT